MEYSRRIEWLKMSIRFVMLIMSGFVIHLLYRALMVLNLLVLEMNSTHQAIDNLVLIMRKSLWF